ncbi:MAG: 2-C-methyl-D-erythritol 2,4-cyclodiphosphate synthase [Spirochaetes bacterium]|nr:2-C-methyl-D-erythritol 2,4-cyclodiphosphate synthase [Spirochaetota bacterium]
MELKIGSGYDIHKLVKNRPFILGNVKIPYKKGFLAHSDGDVLIHSIIDALLGAANRGDIGTLFPDNDPAYHNIDSKILLEKVVELLNPPLVPPLLKGEKISLPLIKGGFEIINIDTTIICEKPKLAVYIPQMKENLSQILKIEENKISIKAKTKEKLDSVGKGKAVEVFSICLLSRL